MILDLIEGLAQVLQDEWHDITVYKDKSEELGSVTPNFFISVSSSEEKPLMGERCVRQIPVEIRYHPDDPGDLAKCYGIAERLFEVTGMVPLPNGGNARGQGKKFEFTQGVIIFHVSFDFILTIGKETDEEMRMGTVDVQSKLGVNGN